MEEDNKNSEKFKEVELKCEEYLNNWKRAAADMANYKKDEAERVGAIVGYAKEDMILNILPVLDSIYLAQSHMPEVIKSNEWSAGFMQIEKQIKEFLKKERIEEIETMGKKFDPEMMEAVAEAESSDNGTAEGGDEGNIAEELQKGYKMGDKVIRPAKVKIYK